MTRARDDLSPAYVAAVLDYDPVSGDFRWRYRANASPQWNGRFAGKLAGTVNDRGYVIICIDGGDFRAHRLAWAIMTGGWPSNEIDHDNLDKGDNSWSNLRESTHGENNRNKPAQSNNSSGFKGVSYCKLTRQWIARIMVGGKYLVVGKAATPELAHQAYSAAALEHHGKFARVG